MVALNPLWLPDTIGRIDPTVLEEYKMKPVESIEGIQTAENRVCSQ